MLPRTSRPHRRPSRFGFESLEERVVLSSGLVGPELGGLEPLATEVGETISASATSTHGSAFNLPQTHQQYPYRGQGYTVAVIDSGIDYRHPALGGKYGAGGRVIGGWDFVDGRSGSWVEGDSTPGPDADPMDVYGHGTMIAGVIGSQDDVYPGVAPGVNFVSLRVLDANGSGDLQWLKDALQWVVNHREEYNIVAVNMSVGVGNYSQVPPQDLLAPQLKTLNDQGVFITAASGNNFYSFGSRQGLAYPAVSPYVVSVGAVYDGVRGLYNWPDGARDYSTAADRIASFTQRGPGLDLLTPGAIVTSTQLSHGGNENYGTYFGTSLASAIASGAAVLARESAVTVGRTDLVDQQSLLEIFQATGVTVNDGDDEQDNVVNTGLNFQRLDLLAAISYIESLAGQGDGEHGDPQAGSGSQNPQDKPTEGPSTPVQQLAADRFERNEKMADAAKLGWLEDAVFSELTLHDSKDVDWYMFGVNQKGKYRVELKTPADAADVDLVFHSVIKGKEQRVVVPVRNGSAAVDVDLRDKAHYFLEVRSDGDPSIAYSLTFTSDPPAGPVNPKQSASGVPDRFESNETSVKSTFLGVVNNTTLKDLTLHSADDVDYFRFQSEKRKYKIELEVVGGGEARFTFYDVSTNRERTLYSSPTSKGAVLEVDLRDRVNYFVKVESEHPVDYILRFI